MNKSKMLHILVALAVCAAPEALSNGYGEYPSRLAWSPDGNILLAALEDRLVLWEDYREPVMVLEGETSSPAFSPDGYLAAFVLDGSICCFEIGRTRSIDLRMLSRPGSVSALAFDPAADPGNPVLCYTVGYLGGDIHVTGFFTGDAFVLLPDDSEALLQAPIISPDGRNIACVNFAANPTWYEELYLLGDAAPFGRRARTDSTFRNWSSWHESNPVWLSNDLLLFQIGGWGDWELRYLSMRSGGDKVLLEDASQPAVALDGRFLAFCRKDPFPQATHGRSWEEPTTVWVMDRNTGYMAQASEQGAWACQPAISHDGKYIAWIERRPEGEELRVFRSEEFINFP